MGCGKSTVGKVLAKKLSRTFVDTDQLIEQFCGQSIKEIFKKHGEDFFRKLESKIILQLSRQNKLIVSLGGGAILSIQNRSTLKRGVWINLKASPTIILKRLVATSNRPLLKKNKTAIESLLKLRTPLYNLAPCQINTDGFAPHVIAQKIIKLLD